MIVDKSNIVARVFHMKMRFLLKIIKKNQIFDKFLDWIWIVKYQKQDLSHLHFFLFLKNQNNFLDFVFIDNIICAELLNLILNLNDVLRQIVQSQITHDFCDSVLSTTIYMIQESEIVFKCLKKYSRFFQEKIIVKKNDYFIYRRRNNNCTWFTRLFNDDVFTFDNRWMMFYNFFLTRRSVINESGFEQDLLFELDSRTSSDVLILESKQDNSFEFWFVVLQMFWNRFLLA